MPQFNLSKFATQDDMYEAMQKHITKLEAELEAVGAGGVQSLGSPLKTAEGAIATAVRLLRENADALKQAHTWGVIGRWDESESEAKAAYDELIDAANALLAAPQPQVEPAGHVINDDVLDRVSLALRKAWKLGQTYWQQADSEFISQQNKSDATQAKFQALIDETREALATTQPAAMPTGWVPCIITYEGQDPEEVAYGPQIMMDRLKKWLERYFELRAQPAPVGEYPALPKALDCFYDEIDKEEVNVYSDYQMRAFADATHAMRAGEQEPAWYFVSGPSASCFETRLSDVEDAVRVMAMSTGDDPDDYTATPLYTSPVATQGERLDAKRYRWLREQPQATWARIGFNTWKDDPDVFPHRDAEIDALSATTPPVAKEG